MALDFAHLLTSFLLLFVLSPFVAPRTLEPTESPFAKTLRNLESLHKGQTAKGLGELKTYLKNFGYINNDHNLNTLPDRFDDTLESAIKDYQKFYGLDINGRLDSATIQKLSLPRCGLPDISKHNRNKNGLIMVSNYTFFGGSPKWQNNRRDLTYVYRSSANVLDINEVRDAIQNAFISWEQVTDFTFNQVDEGQHADIVIGFHSRDHGDGYPFDGPGRVLAHAFAPQDGRLHLDGDEKWSTNPSSNLVDLESVAVHEIGHILGLGHSYNLNAVMYPSYSHVKRNLGRDDIDGIRNLYQY
ncbi:hypothetical protein L6164_008451 [Bauhinia variegata]|uniref:Uncharacterized protein n=1 Tax=Bauhinia variegata TaxID=167791 RepID=A0ACB9PI47_BAUVA|nr:hypothetical protein L6164_008451 [Bauhinia variegata]